MLTFELRHEICEPIEVFGLGPDYLAKLSLETVRQTRVYVANQSVKAADIFHVTGDPADGRQRWAGDLRRVAGIGNEMRSGWIQIESDVAGWLGAQMSDGIIQVAGNVGDHTGCEMTGGIIHVRGNVGSFCGSSLSGADNGQNGGAILVEGNAGDCLGQQMRRGIIAVAGEAGKCCGYLMRAGTILVGGQVGRNAGAEMVRGTIVAGALGKSTLRGFLSAGVQPMPVIALLRRTVSELGMVPPPIFSTDRFELYHGDLLHGGRGELLVPST